MGACLRPAKSPSHLEAVSASANQIRAVIPGVAQDYRPAAEEQCEKVELAPLYGGNKHDVHDQGRGRNNSWTCARRWRRECDELSRLSTTAARVPWFCYVILKRLRSTRAAVLLSPSRLAPANDPRTLTIKRSL
jgi:hypothetical protein